MKFGRCSLIYIRSTTKSFQTGYEWLLQKRNQEQPNRKVQRQSGIPKCLRTKPHQFPSAWLIARKHGTGNTEYFSITKLPTLVMNPAINYILVSIVDCTSVYSQTEFLYEWKYLLEETKLNFYIFVKVLALSIVLMFNFRQEKHC